MPLDRTYANDRIGASAASRNTSATGSYLVYDRFTEGFDTDDLKAAKALLRALADPAALRTRVS